MRRSTAPLLLLGLFLSVALFGCGGGEDETGTTGTESIPTTATGTTSAPQRTSSRGTGGGNGSETQSGRGGISAPRAPSNPASLPEPTEGSKRAAPGVPVSRGGDNSIQTWGTEASATEREEVTQTLQAFYDARADGEWARACSYLAARQKAEFAGFVKGKSGNVACAEAMRGLASQVPAGAFDREAQIEYVLSLRVSAGTAFLIYTRPDGKVYAHALRREDEAWKMVSVGPTRVNP